MIDPNTGVEAIVPPASGNPSPGQGVQAPAQPAPSAVPAGQGQGPKQVPIQALHEEREKRQSLEANQSSLQTEIDNLKAMLAQQTAPLEREPQQQPQQQQFQPNLPQEDVRARLDKLWEEDPRAAMQQETMMALQWRDWVDSNVEYQMDEVRSAFPDFKDYEGSVRKYVRALPLEERTKPNLAKAAYFMVRGQKVDDIVKARDQILLDKIRRGESVQGLNVGSYGTPAVGNAPAVTEQERTVASAMGMTIEEYLKYKK